MLVVMSAAVCLRWGWRGGLDYMAAQHVTVSASLGIFCVVLGTAGLYDSDRQERLGRTIAAAMVALLGGTLLATALLWATSVWGSARGIVPAFAMIALLALLAMRMIHRLLRGLGFMTTRCIVIGTDDETRRAIDLIRRHPRAGLHVVATVGCGTEESLMRLVRVHGVDQIIIAAPRELDSTGLRQLRSLRYRGIALADYVSLHEELTQQIPVEDINEDWLLAASMNSSRPHVRRIKRAVDLLASVGALVLTAPIAATAALLVKLGSPGPVHHRQERMGRNGAVFTILKFRTMFGDAESRTGPVWAMDNDPRITCTGRWLRRFHIDEIPQFINVLRGEMSVVGPRPEREVFVNSLAAQIPFYAERLMVHPGMTGWAQVTQPYAASTKESRRKFQADLYYIKHMSFLTDASIILKTVNIILFGHAPTRMELPESHDHPLVCVLPVDEASH